MDERTLRILEYDKILEMLAAVAPTEGSAARALALRPFTDPDKVREAQARTSDAKMLMGLKGMPSFGRVKDISEAVDRAGKQAVLSLRELLDCAAVLKTSAGLKGYFSSERFPDTSLGEIFERLTGNRDLELRITRTVIAEDFVADDASPELSSIRRKIRLTDAKIKEMLQKYVSGQSKYLQENIVTTRGGRMVIPVKAEYRNEVKGLIHDTSNSGATLFIEPLAVVEANNELRELEIREAKEIERILRELSEAVWASGDVLVRDYYNITELAFYFACAQLSYDMEASSPKISDRMVIDLVKARHPLLDREKVVPVTVSLGRDYRMMVITGPNTGGKTVTLKTLGLFVLMAQSGLHIPAEDTSSVGVFDEVFSDIGDEQSIEMSLSTFSSHMKVIVSIINRVRGNSLVLYDELGSGTDPVEGAALAMAILEEARMSGVLCAATTHYAELKAYAIETEGVVNASCEFDIETLSPTYRLIIGAPGKSNAFAISENLGLPLDIIKRAERYVDTGSRSFEAVIEKLDEQRLLLEKEREAEAERERKSRAERESMERELKQRLENAEKESKKMLAKAHELLDGARATSEFVMGKLEDLKKQQNSEGFASSMAEARAEMRRRMREYGDKLDPVGIEDDGEEDDGTVFGKGDVVIHRAIGTRGKLLEDPDKNGFAQALMGSVKMKVNTKDLKLAMKAEQAEREEKKNQRSTFRASVKRDFKTECDVRGMTGEEAWVVVDAYIDSAIIAGTHTATVIHGKGTGALRSSLWNRFKNDKRIKSFRAGSYGEGDYGVTVLEV